MAAGVPVLATDVGGPAEILRPARAGILLPPRDPAPWAASAARLLADPAAREAMGGGDARTPVAASGSSATRRRSPRSTPR